MEGVEKKRKNGGYRSFVRECVLCSAVGDELSQYLTQHTDATVLGTPKHLRSQNREATSHTEAV